MREFRNYIYSAVNLWIEKFFFRLIRRKRQSRNYSTNHFDEYIDKAIKAADTPLQFYSTSPPVNSEDFCTVATRRYRNVQIETILFTPRFYHLKSYNIVDNAKCRDNELMMFKNVGAHSKVALILLNAWGVKEKTNSDQKLALRLADKYGISVLLSTIPYHRRRTPPGFESGELALNGDTSASLRCFKQAVEESIALAKYLKTYKDFESVGIGGISLGGMIASVSSYIYPFDFGIQILSSGNPASVIWDSPRLEFLKKQFLTGGVLKHVLERHWSVIDPARFVSISKTRTILLILGNADTVIPQHVSTQYSNILQAEPAIKLELYKTNFSHYTGIYFAHHLHRIVGKFILRAVTHHAPERKGFKWGGQKKEKSAVY